MAKGKADKDRITREDIERLRDAMVRNEPLYRVPEPPLQRAGDWRPIAYHYDPGAMPNWSNNAGPNYAASSTTAGAWYSPPSQYETPPTPAPTERFWIVVTEALVEGGAKEFSLQGAIELANKHTSKSERLYIMECKGWVEKDGDETRYVQAPPPEETK